MTTAIEYALMAGASYISTRPDPNKFPIPQGWVKVVNPDSYVRDTDSGFEAISFTKGTGANTEIVISYAGTYDNPLNPLTNPDLQADIGLATGFGSDQLLQAAEYYVQVKMANPDANITFMRDLNANGTIDNGAELFGNYTRLNNGETAANGFAAMADLDGNHDGKLDSQDSAWSSLKVWQDANGDGITDEGELKTLEELGITSIGTGYTSVPSTDAHGNLHWERGGRVAANDDTANAWRVAA